MLPFSSHLTHIPAIDAEIQIKLFTTTLTQILTDSALCVLLQKMGCGVTCVDNVLTRSFYRLGVQIGHTPGYFLIVPILLTLLCITGYQQIHYQMDPEYLFSPEKGPGKTERAIVETYFKMNYTSRFNPTRITRPG